MMQITGVVFPVGPEVGGLTDYVRVAVLDDAVTPHADDQALVIGLELVGVLVLDDIAELAVNHHADLGGLTDAPYQVLFGDVEHFRLSAQRRDAAINQTFAGALELGRDVFLDEVERRFELSAARLQIGDRGVDGSIQHAGLLARLVFGLSRAVRLIRSLVLRVHGQFPFCLCCWAMSCSTNSCRRITMSVGASMPTRQRPAQSSKWGGGVSPRLDFR